jgi:prepilin-type N-terminal cleavage/methylation domain-containing protein
MSSNLHRFQQGGFTLLELSVSIGIMALLMVVAIEARVKELRDVQIGVESAWVIDAMKDVRDGLSNDASFARVSDSLLNVNSVPLAYLTVTGASVVVGNGMGGRLHVASRNMASANMALALTYTNVSREVCTHLVAGFEAMAKTKGAPLYAIVGSQAVLDDVPDLNWSVSDQTFAPVTTGRDVLLKKNPAAQLDVVTTAQFCRQMSPALKSITLIRAWA